MISDLFRRKQMIPILTIGEVVGRQVCPEKLVFPKTKGLRNIPRHDDLIINAIQLHMLKSPSFIDPRRNILFPQPSQVWCMVHSNLNTIRSKLFHQRRQQRCAGWVRRFTSSSQGIRKNAQLDIRIFPQRLLQSFDKFLFRLSNIQRRQKDSSLGIPYPFLNPISPTLSYLVDDRTLSVS